MASRRLCVAAFCCFLLFNSLSSGRLALADAGIPADVEEVAASARPDASLKEFELLRSKISALESAVEARAHELKFKDDRIVQLEKIIQEKSDNLASMQLEIDSLQGKRAADAEDQVGKAQARATELENQLAVLKSKIDLQNKQKEAVKLQATDAERKAKELTAKIESFEEMIEEQKGHILKLEKARLLAEKKLLKAQSLAESKIKELSVAQNTWLPHWVAVYSAHLQSLAANVWNEHGKPAWNFASQQALEITAIVQEWAKPHIEEINSALLYDEKVAGLAQKGKSSPNIGHERWIPVLKEKWVELSTSVEPHVRTVAAKSIEVYDELKTAVTPHIVKVKEMVDPYLEDVKRISKPYVDQIATFVRPHVDRITVALKPYTKQAIHVYRKSLKSVTTYHHQVQSNVRRKLKENELTRPLATKEIVWYLASVILALPVLAAYNVYSLLFRRKVNKPDRGGQSNHTHRRHKRRHA